MNRTLAETERKVSGLLAVGSVTALVLDDPQAPRARVRLDGIESAPLPWLALRAGDTRAWQAPSVGEQVLIACLNGDPANGIILGSLFCEAYPAPADTATLTRIEFKDGAVLEYDSEAHALAATLPEGGTLDVTAPGGVRIDGDVTIDGAVSVSGDVAADGDVKAGAISLQTHVHGGVQPGGGATGLPQ